MNDRNRIIDMLTALAEVLGVELSSERLVGYVAALDDLTADEIATACGQAARHGEFFPRPAELRAYVRPAADGARHPATVWPAGWQAHCPHGTCVIPTQCPEAWAWVKAAVLAEQPEGATA